MCKRVFFLLLWCRLGSLQSARFLELGFRMLTEGEPLDKVARLSSSSSSSPPPPPPLAPTTDTTGSHPHPHPHPHPHHLHLHHDDDDLPASAAYSHPSDGDSQAGLPDMPAFPERGGPPPLTTAGLSLHEHRLSVEMDASSESPEGSTLSGSEGGRYGDRYGGDKASAFSRKQREFIPENRKDQLYWEKRRKNNEVGARVCLFVCLFVSLLNV